MTSTPTPKGPAVPAYFSTTDDDVLHPTSAAVSGWGPDQIRGPAVAAALVRAAETLPPSPQARLARVTFELFRPSRMLASTTDAAYVRRGRRLTLVDTSFRQDGAVTARAHLMFLATGADASGELWSESDDLVAPPHDQPCDDEGRLYRSDDQPWTADVRSWANAARKQVWQRPGEVVEGETPSAYQLAAAASDMTNLVVHAGSRGVEHINADICLTLVREPSTSGIGIAATGRLTDAGISAGSAMLFDRAGAFGITTVAALSNGAHAVDLTPRPT